MMTSLPRVLCQVYVLVLLLGAAVFSPLPYSPVALVLLVAMLLLRYQPRLVRVNTAVTLAAVFLLALVLEPLLEYLSRIGLLPAASVGPGVFMLTPVHLIVPVAILPVVYLLDRSLIQSARDTGVVHDGKAGRYVTTTTVTLFASALVMLLISPVVSSVTLFLTSLFFMLYLLAILLRTLWAVPKLVLEVPVVERRVIAGNTLEATLHPVSKAPTGLYGTLSTVESWVRVSPRRFSLDGAGVEVPVSVTPPLAGPSEPELRVSVVDQRGLLRVNQVVAPLRLHVIPRARYAEWLAARYLEQTGGMGIEAASVPRATLLQRRGMEYLDSRSYQPGDELRRVDWKHTIKLGQLTVKVFVEPGGHTAIIGVNLSVSDAEEADILAFDLITTALTLAEESVPTSLAAYDHRGIVLTTASIDPRKILQQALGLVKEIVVVEPRRRSLQPADIGRLRRDIVQLKRATSGPAQRLLDILDFEYRAIEGAARKNPVTLALFRCTKHMPAPTTIMLVSRLNYDAEAVQVATEKLSRRGFNTLPVTSTGQHSTGVSPGPSTG